MLDFLSLPAEIRLQIYHSLIPHHCIISFTPSHVTTSDGYAIPPAYNARLQNDPSPIYYSDTGLTDLSISTNLFLVNRQISQEVVDILYHQNTFRFVISHAPARVHGCRLRIQHYVPNSARQFPMLKPLVARHMKSMHLYVSGDIQDRRINQNIAKWLIHIASNLTEARNQLEHLRITLVDSKYGAYDYIRRRTSAQIEGAQRTKPIQKGQYVLEPLVKLRGLKNVVIQGEFRDGFATKLARLMESQDVPLPMVEYQDKIVWRRRYGQKKRSKLVLPEKEWFEPVYDWNAVQEVVKEDGE
jgi:hypothetical protein